MTTKIATRADLDALLVDLEAEPDSADRTAAIAKVRQQIADLPADDNS